MNKKFEEVAKKYADAASAYAQKFALDIQGYGYGHEPASKLERVALEVNYVPIFEVQNKDARNSVFWLSKDYQGTEIKVAAPHMGLAIKNIRAIAGVLKRRVKIVPNLSGEALEEWERSQIERAIKNAARKPRQKAKPKQKASAPVLA